MNTAIVKYTGPGFVKSPAFLFDLNRTWSGSQFPRIWWKLPTLAVLRHNRAEGEGCERGSNGVGTKVFIFSEIFCRNRIVISPNFPS
jgi:hypothetical protein